MPSTGSAVTGRSASLPALIGAFASIYFVWGSTFLAIRLAVETIPPATMIGVRSLIAGALLGGFALARGARLPGPKGMRAAAAAGILLFVGGHCLLAWSQQRIPSGQAAVLLATIPLWVPLQRWLIGAGGRPGGRTVVGLLLGFAGVVLLLAPSLGLSGGTAGGGTDPIGSVAALGSAAFWALGTVVSSRYPSSPSPTLASGLQLVIGGALALLIAGGIGEWSELTVERISTGSLLGFGYLVVFGSLLTFGAYTWLLQVCAPEKVATYAYVNPPVALILGAVVLGEPLGLREAAATLVILAAVALVMLSRPPAAAPRKAVVAVTKVS